MKTVIYTQQNRPAVALQDGSVRFLTDNISYFIVQFFLALLRALGILPYER